MLHSTFVCRFEASASATLAKSVLPLFKNKLYQWLCSPNVIVFCLIWIITFVLWLCCLCYRLWN